MISTSFDQELISIINSFLSKSKSGEGSIKSLSYKTNKIDPIYFSCNLLKLKKIFNISQKDIIKYLFLRKKESSLFLINKEFIVRKSLNGAIVINFTDKEVVKFARKSLEPNFIQNEITANKLLPKNTPMILSYGERGNYCFVVTSYYKRSRNIEWGEWDNTLAEISQILDDFYRNNVLVSIKSSEYVQEILNNLDNVATNKKYLVVEFEEIILLLKKCFEEFQWENFILYKIFSHGDLVPNNIIRTIDNTYICDWTNGGLHNIFYDPMMQYFYFTNHELWKRFNTIDFNDDLIHCKRLITFLNLYRRNYNLSFTNKQIKLSFLISLAEVGLKNFLRHQSEEEFLEGENLLKLVREICINILKINK